MFDVPQYLQPLVGNDPRIMLAFYGTVLFLAVIVGLVFWQVFGTGPRRRRMYSAANRQFSAGQFSACIATLKQARQIGFPSAAWTKRFNQLEAASLEAQAQQLIAETRFEDALGLQLKAAQLLDKSPVEVKTQLQGAMLKEVRRLFCSPRASDLGACLEMIGRTLLVQSPSREASFWQGLCDLRMNQVPQAMANLQVARTGQMRTFEDLHLEAEAPPALSPYIDPSWYLGGILLKQGQPRDALRYLTEANRMDAACPMVTLLLGSAMVGAGGDTSLAIRALQKALGPRGLGQWQDQPARAWEEAFPDGRSYVRKAASEQPYLCPLWGSELGGLKRQGSLALAQAFFKLGQFDEAARQYELVLNEGAPSRDVVRGLGLSLAKLGRYDDAFKHLRIAYDLEQPKDRLTAGYLALCGALGTPSNPEDKARNLTWAIQTVEQFNAPGDTEWVGLINHLFSHAREQGLELAADDHLYLCEHLVSVDAHDPDAARAYAQFFERHPAFMRAEYAWLYCRADADQAIATPATLPLYALTFADPGAARAYFEARTWEFEAVELAYLQRAARLAPGAFPAPLGPDYPARGERLLLQRSERLEQACDAEGARAALETLVQLAPGNTIAIDRLARLHFRAGNSQEAERRLDEWHRARPGELQPLARLALLLHQQGRSDEAAEKMDAALALARGSTRAALAQLAARLALQIAFKHDDAGPWLRRAQEYLQDAMSADGPNRGAGEAQWLAAALAWVRGDHAWLVEQSQHAPLESADSRLHFMAAVGHLLAGQLARALDASQRAAKASAPGSFDVPTEARYLAALALQATDPQAALQALQPLVDRRDSPTHAHALALQGCIAFDAGDPARAVDRWQQLDAKKRQTWGLSEPLGMTVFLTALEALAQGRYEAAAEQLRLAGRSGCRDRRLGSLLFFALFKAGQAAVYSTPRLNEPASADAKE